MWDTEYENHSSSKCTFYIKFYCEYTFQKEDLKKMVANELEYVLLPNIPSKVLWFQIDVKTIVHVDL